MNLVVKEGARGISDLITPNLFSSVVTWLQSTKDTVAAGKYTPMLETALHTGLMVVLRYMELNGSLPPEVRDWIEHVMCPLFFKGNVPLVSVIPESKVAEVLLQILSLFRDVTPHVCM